MSFMEYFLHTEVLNLILAVIFTVGFGALALIVYFNHFFDKTRAPFIQQPPSGREWKVFCLVLLAWLSPLGVFLSVTLANAHSRYWLDEQFLGAYELTFQLEGWYDNEIRGVDKIVGDYAACTQAKRVLAERMGIQTKCLLVGVEQKPVGLAKD